MTLNQMYGWIRENFAFYRTGDQCWQVKRAKGRNICFGEIGCFGSLLSGLWSLVSVSVRVVGSGKTLLFPSLDIHAGRYLGK